MKKCSLNQPAVLPVMKEFYPEFVGLRNGKDKVRVEDAKKFYLSIDKTEKKELLLEAVQESSIYLEEKKKDFYKIWQRADSEFGDFYTRYARNEKELKELAKPRSDRARRCQRDALVNLSIDYTAPNLLKETVKLTGLARLICTPPMQRQEIKEKILSNYQKFQEIVANKVDELDRFFTSEKSKRYITRSAREIRLLWSLFPLVHQRMVEKRTRNIELSRKDLRDLGQICRLDYIQYERDIASYVVTWAGFAASAVGLIALTPITGGASLLALVGVTEGWVLGLGLSSSILGSSISLFDYSLLSTEMGRIFHQGQLANRVKFYTNSEWQMLRQIIYLVKTSPQFSKKVKRFLLRMISHDPYYYYLQEESKRVRKQGRIPIHRVINYVTFALGIGPTVVGFSGLANAINAKPESALRALEEIAEVGSRYQWSTHVSATNTAINFLNSGPDVVEFLRGLSRPQLEIIYRLIVTAISAGTGQKLD